MGVGFWYWEETDHSQLCEELCAKATVCLVGIDKGKRQIRR